jgi:Tfp pilus assembly protein PilF
VPGLCPAQQEDTQALDQTAKAFIRQGDYNNAVLVLNNALKKDPKDLECLKDLAFTYYLDRNFEKALTVAKPIVERPDADVQSFQILGMVYKATESGKECEKMYREGLKRFPRSGVLNNEYGEVLGTSNGVEAIKYWERGIQADPNYSSNYYNASKYYYTKNNKIWCVLYSEIFVNLESYSQRTLEMKDVLMEEYKKIFADADLFKNQGTRNAFESAFIAELGLHASTVISGVDAESLTMLRSEFILSWFGNPTIAFPYRLFDYHRQLLKEGLFNAYNQWLFGAAQDQSKFQAWCNSHTDEYSRFTKFQGGRIFKLPEGQYYQTQAK